MVSVNVRFRPSSVEGKEGAVYYQIIRDRVVVRYNTPYHIFPEEWDARNSRIVVPCRESARYEYVMSVESDVGWELARLPGILGRDFQKGTDIREVICSYLSGPQVFEYMRHRARYLMDLGRVRSSETLTAALNSLMRFRGGADMTFMRLDKELVQRFEAYMRQNGLSRNTTSFYMRNLRSAYNCAVEEGITSDGHPFTKVYTGVDRTSKRAVTLDDIRKIRRLDLSSSRILSLARDLLMFSFYTRGMSFVDMAYLRKSDIRDGCIIYRRKKTGQELLIGIEPEIREIMERYHTDATGYLLPIISSEDGSERKQYRNMLVRINRSLKLVGRMAGTSVPLSTYVARHSWATIARNHGVPLSVISSGLGHDNENTTKIYLDSIHVSAVNKANRAILDTL